ncbi:MAG: hypothetical protein BWY75_02833 [bacterium ADurb.Bin425]|nr:MAG: hypothetical protein BWY75_02833 [bacterium ADurb.Bin425]
MANLRQIGKIDDILCELYIALFALQYMSFCALDAHFHKVGCVYPGDVFLAKDALRRDAVFVYYYFCALHMPN